MKYDISENQNEILPNIQGIKTTKEIALAEFEGFLKAEIKFTETLKPGTRFDVAYILSIHKVALGNLYPFAGKYRDVNLSKGGFPFAAARFLPETTNTFDREILSTKPRRVKYNSIDGKNEIDIVREKLKELEILVLPNLEFRLSQPR